MRIFIAFFFLLFAVGCSNSKHQPLVWKIEKSFKKKGVVEYGKWGTALLQNPVALGVKLFPGSEPSAVYEESCKCSVWKMPANLASSLGAIYKTSMNFLDSRYELVPSPGRSVSATPTLLLTVDREGDYARVLLRAMLESQELGRFDARVSAQLIYDLKAMSQASAAKPAPGTLDLWVSQLSHMFGKRPETSPIFGPINEFLIELGSPAQDARIASKGARL